MKSITVTTKVLVTITGILITFIAIFPFLLMISTSLKPAKEVFSPNLFPTEIAWTNYKNALTRGNWILYFFNSFRVTVVVVIVSIFINSLAGFSFSRLNFRFRDTLFVISLIGLMIPPQARMIPIFLELRFFPLAGGNNIFGRGGSGLINTFTGLILPMIAGSFGMFLFRQFFLNFPSALDDAAKIDGLNEFKTYLFIYLPLSQPVIASLVAIKAAYTWNQYIWPLILTKGDKLRTVQLALTLFKDEDIIEWNLLMAATTTILIPMIVLFFVAQKYFVRGIVTSGIKG